MKPSEQHLSEVCRRHTEAVVARHVHELFKRLPILSGFWLRPDLKVAELSVFYLAGLHRRRRSLRGRDAVARRLAEEHPEAVQLMRGRTFARAVH